MYIRYSDELIEEIRINNDIIDVVSEYVRLEKRGKNHFGLCPFHKEKTPSFSVESGKQIFYCFGCGKGGNVFHFISLSEKLDYIESVRLLADRAKILLPENDDVEQAKRDKIKQSVLAINLLAAQYYKNILNSRKGVVAAEYLKKREISEHTISKFGLGYASDEWDSLYQHLKSKDMEEEDILQSGLIVLSSKGKRYDRFRDRIMFPIYNIRGNVIAFGGRVLDNTIPKYVNSPETALYSKGKHLYALNFAKNTDSKRLVIVEGYMDVISLHQSGIGNVVASLGTALTESQGRILKKYAEEIVISYDTDTAGKTATHRGLNLLNDIGCNVKVLIVPDGKDPDDYIRKNGPDAFRKLVNDASSLVEYKVKVLRDEQDISTTDGKILFLNKAAAVLSEVDNNMEREMHIKKLSQEYEISEQSVLAEVLRRTRPAANQNLKVSNAAKASKISKKAAVPGGETVWKLLHDERFILSLLCIDNSIYNTVKENFMIEMFSGEENRRVAAVIFKSLEKRKGFTPAELLNVVLPEHTGEFARILKEECYCDDNRKAIMGKIRDIEILNTEMRQRQILDLLKDESKLPEGDVDILKLEFKSLTQRMRDIKKIPL